MKAKEPAIQLNFTVNGKERLHNVWWIFPEYLAECDRFGIFPGVYIDAK